MRRWPASSIHYRDRMLIVATRIVAVACAVVGSLAYVTIFDRYFEAGIWPLLTWFALAGVALGIRMLPTGPEADRVGEVGFDATVAPRVRPTLVDLGIVLGVSVVGGYLALLAFGRPATDWPMPLFMVLLLTIAVLIGLLVGMIVVVPIAMLGRALVRVLTGRPVAAASVVIATLLLTVVAFATVTGFAIDAPAGGTSRGRAWEGILVVLTGLSAGGAVVVSQPLAWIARGLAVLIVVQVVALVRASARRRRATR